MRKITVFNFITLDGYFAGPHGEIDWFKTIEKDEEYDAYTKSQAKIGEPLIFGRTTYEMMKSYWPTEFARENDPVMADAVNLSPKIVFSKKLQKVEEEENWKNVRMIADITSETIKAIKEEEGKNLTVLGSGSIVQQLANLGMIDEYQFMVVPIVLGAGKSMFAGVQQTSLKLLEVKLFKNGIVSLRYSVQNKAE
jgi:dihydrofolate reductase